MKIAVVGCGAVGSYYGGRLVRAGENVHFLLRSDYEVVRRKGLFVRSTQGDFHVQPKCARTPEEIGPSDLVLIALKTTANSEFPKLLPPLVGKQTAVLTLQNGLGNEEQLAELFRVDQIMGGLCFVCLNRTEPGVVHHIDHGQVIMGEFQRWPEPRTHDIAARFRHAGIPCKVTANLAQTHWEKLVWNIPFNGLGVAGAAVSPDELMTTMPTVSSPSRSDRESTVRQGRPLQNCLTTEQLLADPKWEQVVRGLMTEVIAAARAVGLDVSPALAEKQIERTRTMGAYRASTLIDFERGQALELRSLFLEPLRLAKKAGVSAPRLEALCRVLTHLDPVNVRKS
ncbi:MAG TPA: 2-dehydropantoate 2-reductase [Candidatus Dormibacteraeota bacterium]|nr:2-dehydropantoate 2-reductase [Candidatus Dormibacteraeota bacterium]